MYGDYNYFFNDKSGSDWCSGGVKNTVYTLTKLKCDQSWYYNYFPDGCNYNEIIAIKIEMRWFLIKFYPWWYYALTEVYYVWLAIFNNTTLTVTYYIIIILHYTVIM